MKMLSSGVITILIARCVDGTLEMNHISIKLLSSQKELSHDDSLSCN